MGNLEKLVVLVVLFLVAIVLGVTMNSSGDADDLAGPGGVARIEGRATPSDSAPAPSGPLDAARRRSGELQPLPAAVSGVEPEAGTESGAARSRRAGFARRDRSAANPAGSLAAADGPPPTATPLLSATVRRPGSANAKPKPAKPLSADGRILITEKGLSPIPGLDDCMRYTVRERETWAKLSERFYGERRYTDLLRQANDDPGMLSEGMELLVPLFDLTRSVAVRPPAQPAQRKSLSDAEVTSYTIVSGDSLSVISQKVYGTSRRWREIFEANRALLADEHTLEVGLVLDVPR